MAIRSIQWQTYPHWELLVIDDGSRDGAEEVARHFAEGDGRIRVLVDGGRHGIAYRLNQAIALSRGRYFARMDGDDVSYPERLERQLAYLDAHPEIDLVGAGAVVFNGDGVAIGKRYAPELHETICARPYAGIPVVHPTFLGRVEAFRAVGYTIGTVQEVDRDHFAATFPNGLNHVPGGLTSSEEQDLLMRAHQRLRYGNVPEVLLGYREAELRIVKQWFMRGYVIKSLYYNLWKHRRYGAFLSSASVVLLKGSVDAVAIATGLNYHVLRHRARPITAGERELWERVWIEIGKDLGPA